MTGNAPKALGGGGMAKLTTRERKDIPAGEFAVPGKRAYPIENPGHARNALARVSQHGSPAEKSEVRSAVHRRYPGIGKAHHPGSGCAHHEGCG